MTTHEVDQEASDAFDPAAECRARQPARQIIGVPPHTHVCREETDHRTALLALRTPHRCGCGHAW